MICPVWGTSLNDFSSLFLQYVTQTAGATAAAEG